MITTESVTWREYLAEWLMTFILSFVAITALFRAPSFFVHVIIAITFGVLFILFRKKLISFGNPVIALALMATRKISVKLALAFVSIQMAAGSVAGLVVFSMTKDFATRYKGLVQFAQFSWTSAVAETLAGFLLTAGIFALMHSTKTNDENSAVTNSIFVVYGSLLIAALLGSLGFVNPAFSFATLLFGNVVYLVAPVVGGILGAVFYMVVCEGKSLSSFYQSNSSNL